MRTGGEAPRAGSAKAREGVCIKTGVGLPQRLRREPGKLSRGASTRTVVARSESLGEGELEVWKGMRQGEAGAQESLEMTECLQQHWATGFAKSGIELPKQAKAVNPTTNLFI